MSNTPDPIEPPRDIIAPRHESLAKQFNGDIGPRPLDYGEARLWLVARDPRWLFAYWQFVPTEHPEAFDENGRPRFFLRIIAKDRSVEAETDIQPDHGNIYLPANVPDSAYTAELGFYAKSGVWCFIANSGITHTPPLNVGKPGPVEVVRIPAHVPLTSGQPFEKWPIEKERMFIRLLSEDVAAGGLPEGRAARARAKMIAPTEKEIPAALWESLDPAADNPAPSSWANAGNSPQLHINAEIVLYGGTEPGTSLTIAGKPADLRHDGSFRVHTRLPDGEFEIPIVVRSADGLRVRKATLRFSRETTADPGTTATPQPDYLAKSPPCTIPPA